MAEQKTRKIQALTTCKLVDQGESCQIGLFFEGDSKEILEFPTRLLPMLVTALAQAGREAALLRDGKCLELVAPFHLKEVTRTGLDLATGRLAIEIAVTEGFPLILSMTQNQAAQAIETLQTAIARAQSATSGQQH